MKVSIRNRFVAKGVNGILRLYWFLIRPKTRGVKILIFNNKKQVLMVRLTYYPNMWTFPGGGVHKNEKPKEAVLRECREEVGIEPTDVTYITTLHFTHEYKNDTLFVYKAKSDKDTIKIDGREVAEAKWFNLHQPPTMGENAKRILETLNNI